MSLIGKGKIPPSEMGYELTGQETLGRGDSRLSLTHRKTHKIEKSVRFSPEMHL